MSDENQNDQQQQDESPNAKRMREQMEALKEQNDALLSRVRLSAFKEAGLDPEAGGLNKAVYRTYDGEPDPEKIREFATNEYDWAPANPGPSDAQQRISALGATGTPPEPENNLDKAHKAAVEGDWVKSAALKDKELLALTNKRFGY